MNFKKDFPYQIRIDCSANGGYRVEIGCCNLVYTDKVKLVTDLADYLDNPKAMEEQYYKFTTPEPERVEHCEPDRPRRLGSGAAQYATTGRG